MEVAISFECKSQLLSTLSVVWFTNIIKTIQLTVNAAYSSNNLKNNKSSTGYQKYLTVNVCMDESYTGQWFVSLADTGVTITVW
jgi:hypothetical protein